MSERTEEKEQETVAVDPDSGTLEPTNDTKESGLIADGIFSDPSPGLPPVSFQGRRGSNVSSTPNS